MFSDLVNNEIKYLQISGEHCGAQMEDVVEQDLRAGDGLQLGAMGTERSGQRERGRTGPGARRSSPSPEKE